MKAVASTRSAALDAAKGMLGVSLDALWLDYFGLGGSLRRTQIGAFLAGEQSISDHDHDVLVQALNERFLDRGEDHPLDYADELLTDGG